MRIALVIERIETWRGGAETSSVQFANHLADLGVEVVVVTTSHLPSTPAMKVMPVRANSLFRFTKTRQFADRADAYLRSENFDIIHAITPCNSADVYQPRGGTMPETLARNLALRGTPLRKGLKRLGQGTSLKYRIQTGLEKRLLSRTPGPWVIAISDYVADQLRRHYGYDPDRIRLIFNGVDPDETPPEERRKSRVSIRRQYDLADDDYVLLCVAHNFKLKGVHKAIEALARARDHHWLVVVGRGNPAHLAKLASRVGVADRIIFAGASQRVAAFMHAADVLMHPTYYDPCSRVVLEALSSGLPAVTTRFNGAAERIVDGRHGYVVDTPNDIDALADRINRLADGDHRRDCALHAPEAVEGISMKEHAEKVLALYHEIVGQKGERPAEPGMK